ncbi:MAG: helix-turn-helix transcriptional regulator [Lachnospiraceae bacterium]|nr:helix-turn-helix transcriptional regulator [Lachnospiraceae bacterium]
MKKRKYLYRLTIIVILILFLPTILFMDISEKKAFVELEKANEAYYDKMLDAYISLFDDIIQELNTFAASISAESRNYTNLLYNGVEELEGNYLHLYNVANALKEKKVSLKVSDWGIYVYDIDRIINPSSTLSSEQFIFRYENQARTQKAISQFFSEENYERDKKLFCTTNDENCYDGDMLIGICTRIGKNNDKVLIYFKVSPQDIENSLVIMDGRGKEFYLADNATEVILLSWGQNAGENIEKVVSLEVMRKVDGMSQKALYKKDSGYTNLSIYAYITEESLQNSIMEYSHNTHVLFLTISFVLMLICMIATYIAYKPVKDLTEELDWIDNGEFEAVRNILDVRRTKIIEQEMLIMDMLFNNLLYGAHVSEKAIKRLGVDTSMQHYCVFMLQGYILPNSTAEVLADEMMKKYQVRLFITDLQGENYSVFIAFLKKTDISDLYEYLKQWVNNLPDEECVLYAGKIVDKLDDIRTSFQFCVEQAKKQVDEEEKKKKKMLQESEKENLQKKIVEDMLAYLEVNYRDVDLNQAQVAELFKISNYTLSRLFKNQVGIGFSEYVVSKRLEYAKELLITSDYTINEISNMAGFNSTSYFCKIFKVYEGISPAAFRDNR